MLALSCRPALAAMEHNDGRPLVKVLGIRTVMNGADAPADPDLLPFWHSVQTAHPRLHRFEDILGSLTRPSC